jgi:hypothetical protein
MDRRKTGPAAQRGDDRIWRAGGAQGRSTVAEAPGLASPSGRLSASTTILFSLLHRWRILIVDADQYPVTLHRPTNDLLDAYDSSWEYIQTISARHIDQERSSQPFHESAE